MKLLSFWNCLLPSIAGLSWAGSRGGNSLSAKPAEAKAAPKVDARRRSGLIKTDAEDLLDWLEANGCPHFEISSQTGDSFAVQWWN